MALLATFVVLAVIGQIANVSACLLLERYYPGAFVLGIFFVSWVAIFWLCWRVAVRLTEPRSRAADQQQLLVVLATALQAPMIV